MKLFSFLYNKTIIWSKHRHAPYFLAGVSFAESSFFPIPPDIMLISMGLARPEHSWNYALIATVFSVVGGIFGYLIGLISIKYVYGWLVYFHYDVQYSLVVSWFQKYGIWVVFLAGFSPIPYKFFTIAAGTLQMSFIPFVIASCIARGLRFYLLSGILHMYGYQLDAGLRKYVDILGWGAIAVFIFLFLILQWLS